MGLKIAHVGVDIAQDGIGRITDDNGDWREGRAQIGVDEVHAVCQIERNTVDVGHGEGVRRDISGDDGEVRGCVGDGHGNAPAAGANIRYYGGVQSLGGSAGEIDEEFTLGAGNEHTGIDIKVESIELARVGQVGDWFAGEASLTQRRKS